jgi:hypothetical protein
MDEAPENGKESLHSAHYNGIIEWTNEWIPPHFIMKHYKSKYLMLEQEMLGQWIDQLSTLQALLAVIIHRHMKPYNTSSLDKRFKKS